MTCDHDPPQARRNDAYRKGDCIHCWRKLNYPTAPEPVEQAPAPALRSQIEPTRITTKTIKTRPARPCNCTKKLKQV